MKHLLLLTVLAALSSPRLTAADVALRNWPSWRGPLLTGVAPNANPPVTWSETNHVKWKVAVPGSGNASPVVWEDQVFVLTAVPTGKKVTPATPAAPPAPSAATRPPEPAPAPAVAPSNPAGSARVATSPGGSDPGRRGGGGGGGAGGGQGRAQVEQPDEEQRFTVISYDRRTGKVLWQDAPRVELPHEGHHKDHGYASASPVTDGEVLIAHFGSRGLYAYDLKGKPLWQKQLGRQATRNSFGEGSSPALYGNTVVLVWDHEGDDFIVALDKRTGRELWRKPREESTNWSTPLVLEHQGKAQAIVNSGKKVKSYDLASGEVLWEAGGQTQNAIPAPVAGHGRVYVTSGWRGAALQAITLGQTGDLTGTPSVAWSHNRNTPYVPSPLLYGDWLYFYSNNNAQLSILDAKDGKAHVDAERLEGIFGAYASPVGASDRVYLTGRNGAIWVIKNGPQLEVLAKNTLDDGFDASPALVGNELFLRGRQHLYALSDGGTISK